MRAVVVAALIAVGATLPLPALAQNGPAGLDARVDRLEHELRAVQRKVFPGSPDGRFVEPEVAPAAPSGPVPGAPASSAVADLTERVGGLEGQLARLTDRVEVSQHRLQQLEEAFNAYKRATDARLSALEAGATANAAPATSGSLEAGPAPLPSRSRPAPASAAPAAGSAAKDPARAERVAAIQRTHSDDPAEDAYMYGYHLWEAKLYPEAEVALKQVVTTYPHHRRASYAQNLLGRAYLDDDKPSLASIAFYDSYKKFPDGERAPDSLFYLAQALMKLNKPADVCKVYGELTDVYGTRLSAQRKAEIDRGRLAAKCA